MGSFGPFLVEKWEDNGGRGMAQNRKKTPDLISPGFGFSLTGSSPLIFYYYYYLNNILFLIARANVVYTNLKKNVTVNKKQDITRNS